MGQVLVDGNPVAFDLPAGATMAAAFEKLRETILASGRIVTEVELGGEPVTWQDGSADWTRSVAESGDLAVATEYPIRISGPLMERLATLLPDVADRHRDVAESFRQQQPTASVDAGKLLSVWQELEHALDQVIVLHGVDLNQSPWKEIADHLRERFGRLQKCLVELRESFELKDLVLAADLMEFELAPLATDFVAPCQQLEAAFLKHFPAGGR